MIDTIARMFRTVFRQALRGIYWFCFGLFALSAVIFCAFYPLTVYIFPGQLSREDYLLLFRIAESVSLIVIFLGLTLFLLWRVRASIKTIKTSQWNLSVLTFLTAVTPVFIPVIMACAIITWSIDISAGLLFGLFVGIIYLSMCGSWLIYRIRIFLSGKMNIFLVKSARREV